MLRTLNSEALGAACHGLLWGQATSRCLCHWMLSTPWAVRHVSGANVMIELSTAEYFQTLKHVSIEYDVSWYKGTPVIELWTIHDDIRIFSILSVWQVSRAWMCRTRSLWEALLRPWTRKRQRCWDGYTKSGWLWWLSWWLWVMTSYD
jgi:hypothetical protein